MDRKSQIKVAIVDQHAVFTECLGMVLERRRYSHCAVALPEQPGQAELVLAELMSVLPDVVLLNVDLGPFCDGEALIAPLVRAGIRVVVLTESTDEVRWGSCLERGARAVLAKDASLASALSVVRRVSQDQVVLERSERDRLIRAHRRQAATQHEARKRLQLLTPQEGEVLRHLMSGRTVKDIAVVRSVSEATVRSRGQGDPRQTGPHLPDRCGRSCSSRRLGRPAAARRSVSTDLLKPRRRTSDDLER